MLPLSRDVNQSNFIISEDIKEYLVQILQKIQLFPLLLDAFLSISIIMLAAFPANILEKDVIKLMKLGSGVKTCYKI